MSLIKINQLKKSVTGIMKDNKQIKDDVSVLIAGNSTINDKKVLIIGDSIGAGYGYNGGFANLISEDFPHSEVRNASIVGSTISDANIYNQILKTYQGGYEPDIIIIDGGGNDLLQGKQLGGFNYDNYDSTGYGEDFDRSTVIGSLEHLFTVVQTFLPNAKCIFTNTYKIRPFDASDDGTSMPVYSEQKTFWEKIEEVCLKYSVLYVDFYGSCNFNPANNAQYNLYMADFLHINEAGYRKLWPLLKKALLDS